jgi:enamine deaminase RidA (YjgF/YER057c/UK114 family)
VKKEFINPDTLGDYSERFSQVVAVTAGGVKRIWVSGQVAIDKEGKLVGGEDVGVQAEQAYKNLSLALEGAGASTDDIVKLNTYVVGYDRDKIGPVGDAMGRHFKGKDRPASTMVWVQSLISRRFLIEVEAEAVVEA